MGFDLPGEGKLGMSDEIKMPEGIARAVVDAIEWMAGEGQWFDDPEQGEKLLAYLREYHPKIAEQSWCLHRYPSLLNEVRIMISGDLPPSSGMMPPSEPEVKAENGDD